MAVASASVEKALEEIARLPWRRKTIATVEEILAVLDALREMGVRPKTQTHVSEAVAFLEEELGLEREEAEKYAEPLAAVAESLEAGEGIAEAEWTRRLRTI